MVNAEVSTFARGTRSAVIDLVVEDNAGANPGANGGIEDVSISLAGSPAALGQRGGIGIVINFYRDPVSFGNLLSERKITPTRNIGRIDHDSRFWIQGTRRTNANTADGREVLSRIAYLRRSRIDGRDHGS